MMNKHHAFVNRLRELVYNIYDGAILNPSHQTVNIEPIYQEAKKIDNKLADGLVYLFEKPEKGQRYLNSYFKRHNQHFRMTAGFINKGKKNYRVLDCILGDIVYDRKKRKDGLNYEVIALDNKKILTFYEYRARKCKKGFLGAGGTWATSNDNVIYHDFEGFRERGKEFFEFAYNFVNNNLNPLRPYRKPDKNFLIKGLMKLYIDVMKKSSNFHEFRRKWINKYVETEAERFEIHELEHLKRKDKDIISKKTELAAMLKEISECPIPHLSFYGLFAVFDKKSLLDSFHEDPATKVFEIYLNAMKGKEPSEEKMMNMYKLKEDEIRRIAREAYLKLN